MTEALSVVGALAAALGLLGTAIALSVFVDRLHTRHGARDRSDPE